MEKYRLTQFCKAAVSGRFVPFRYYLIEFFLWVVCGIDFYKNYRRFYERKIVRRLLQKRKLG
jgi:hypothetical protein